MENLTVICKSSWRPPLRLENVSRSLSISELQKTLLTQYSSVCSMKFRVCSSNKPLQLYQTLSEITHNGLCMVQALLPLNGGKGGFGNNLRSNKGNKQKKKPTEDSKAFSKDLKTGVRIKDLNRLQKASEVLQKQQEHSQEAKEKLDKKQAKLKKAIEYYEGILNGKSNEKFKDTDFLDEADNVMQNLRDKMEVVFELLDSEEWESDWESDEEKSEKLNDDKPVEEKTKPKFATFFDDSD